MPDGTFEYEPAYRHIGGPWDGQVLPDRGGLVVSADGRHMGTYLFGITVEREPVRYWVPAFE